jgi:hypothetical protein
MPPPKRRRGAPAGDPSATSAALNSSPRSSRSDPNRGPRRRLRSSGHIQVGGTRGRLRRSALLETVHAHHFGSFACKPLAGCPQRAVDGAPERREAGPARACSSTRCSLGAALASGSALGRTLRRIHNIGMLFTSSAAYASSSILSPGRFAGTKRPIARRVVSGSTRDAEDA